MNRGRKSISKTPVQKTNLFHFFQRTPIPTPNSQDSSDSIDKNTFTPSLASSSVTSSVSKSRFIECPCCNKTVSFYKLNHHLDNECDSLLSNSNSTNLQSSDAVGGDRTPILNQRNLKEIKTIPDDDIEISVSSSLATKSKEEGLFSINCSQNLEISTPRNIKEGRILESSSKTNDFRNLDSAEDNADGLVENNKRTNCDALETTSQLSDLKKQLFADVEEPEELTNLPYYLETFLFLLKSSFEEPLHQHLFTDKESNAYDNFKSLTVKAQKLYVRLFSRKFRWHRREKIVYEDIATDLTPILAELCASSLIVGIEKLEDLPILLSLLTQFELKQLFKDAKIPYNGKGNASKALLQHCRSQPCLTGSAHSMTDRITTKIKSQYLKECYKLNEEFRRIFLQLIMLSTLHQRQEEEEEKGQQQQSFKMLQVKIGEKIYPSYEIRRQRAIFKKREQFLRYGDASLMELNIRDSYENKQWAALLELSEPAQQLFSEYFTEYYRDDLDLPLFLRRYTAGSVYVYIFNKRIEALQCLKKYQEAVDLIRSLIKQDIYLPTHRGHWYERLALNLEQHLKDPLEAVQAIKDSLNDSWVTPAHRFALSQRATRICQSPKWRQKLESVLSDLPLLIPSEPRSVVITGRSLPRDLPGHKSMFIRGDSEATTEEGDVTLCSVEELVLQHYMENGYTHGVHGEGSTLWAVIGLLFWDIIYLSDVTDVFVSPFQVMPLDFDTLDFYQSRQQVIEERLQCIRTWSSSEVSERIAEVWNGNQGKTSIVSWDRFRDVEHVSGLVQCIAPNVLAAIAQRLLQNYRHYRSGFPDLTVWNPQEKKWRIVEVKGPNDRLSPKQTLWLDFLVSLGVEAEVCHVEAVGARKLGPVSSEARKSKSPRSAENEEDNETNGSNTVRRSRRVKAKFDSA